MKTSRSLNVGTLCLSMFFVLALAFIPTVAVAQDTLRHEVLLETSMGNIRVALSNATPLHRDNFLENVRKGLYDGVLFHRVISSFMIQAGDTASRHAQPGQLLGDTEEAKSIPAEIRFPQLFHKRGALAAAREGDEVNPERRSSSMQFYIVYGRRFTDEMLDNAQQRLSSRPGGVELTPEVREAYKKYGGTPHLDGQYTVFGEVVEGLDVVRDIQWVEADSNDRPLTDVRINKAVVVK